MPAPESEMTVDEWRDGALPQTDEEKLDWLCWWLEGLPNKELGEIAKIVRVLQLDHIEDVHSNLKLQDQIAAAHAQGKAEGLEEAAKIADKWMAPTIGEQNKVSLRIAAAIRARIKDQGNE